MFSPDLLIQSIPDPSWQKVLKDECHQPYMQDLTRFLIDERKKFNVFPPKEHVFQALKLTPFDKVKVVILGQDPYHGAGQAHGLCFSVQPPTPPPPSLINIYKELEADLGNARPETGSLEKWSSQGVLLLNTTLTVREGQPLSHVGQGWERFTDAILFHLAKKNPPVLFLLWGKHALGKQALIQVSPQEDNVLIAAHPSPFSAHRGFLGCRHFSKANDWLISRKLSPIDWSL